MVWVPGGAFQMGDGLDPTDAPVSSVQTAGFWIDQTEVTNAQFAKFVEATGYVTEPQRAQQKGALTAQGQPVVGPAVAVFKQPDAVMGRDDTSQWWALRRDASWRQPQGPESSLEGRDAYPVVGVTYADATAYAQWLGRSLPTEVQWERAARMPTRTAEPVSRVDGPTVSEGKVGSVKPTANTWQGIFPIFDSAEDGFAGLAPVGCYAANGVGAHDLIGNVWEITADVFRGSSGLLNRLVLPVEPSIASAPQSRKAATGLDIATTAPQLPRFALGEAPVAAHVIKGGSFLCSNDFCSRARAGSRQALEDGTAAVHVGFRTIWVDPAGGPMTTPGLERSSGQVGGAAGKNSARQN